MADGSIHIPVKIDDAEAEKRLKQLEQGINKAQNALSKNSGKRDGITAQLQAARAEAEKTAEKINRIKWEMADNESAMKTARTDEEYYGRYNRQQDLQERLERENALYKTQDEQVANLGKKEKEILETITQQIQQLEKLKKEHEDIETGLVRQTAQEYPKVREELEKSDVNIKSILKGVLKWGFGIRSTFILMRRLRSAISEGVKAFAEQDQTTKTTLNELKASLSALKGAWGAAFAPIVNLVGPYLKRFIEWLTNAANAIQMFFAVLGGKNTYKKVIANNLDLADSYSATGTAAAKAAKQILGFDEINQLNDNSGGGGGGGSNKSTFDTVDEQVDMESRPARFALTFKDVLFDWSNLTAEQIAEKALAGLIALGGAITGGMIGGVPGAIIGALAGLALGVALDSTIFDGDGELDGKELGKALISVAGWVAGMAVGFIAGGGPIGASLMAMVGLKLGLDLSNALFNPEGKIKWNNLFSVITDGLGAIGGGAIGAKVGASLGSAGGPVGAIIGLALGLALSFAVKKIDWSAVKQSLKQWWIDFKAYFQERIEHWKEILLKTSSDGELGPADIGFAIMMGILQGIVDPLKNIYDWLKTNVFDPIVDGIKSLFGIDSAEASTAEEMQPIGKSIMEGILSGIRNKMLTVKTWLQNNVINPTVAFIKTLFGIGEEEGSLFDIGKGVIDSLLSGISNAWDSITKFFTESWASVLSIFTDTDWGSVIKSIGNGVISMLNRVIDAINRMGGINFPGLTIWGQEVIPQFSAQLWSIPLVPPLAAKGGIIDKATALIAGEAGKEAIVPLERNTEWIDMVAGGIIDRLASMHGADYVSGLPLPALASGQVVPPRALTSSGSFLSDGDIDRLVSGIVAAFSETGTGEDNVTRLYLDGVQIAECVNKHNRRFAMERGL